MTEPIAQVDVENEILRLSTLLETATQLVAKRARALAEADVDHRTARAHAYLAADGPTVDARSAQADLATEAEYRNKRTCEAVLDAAKEAGRNTRSGIDGLRSIAANHRALVTG